MKVMSVVNERKYYFSNAFTVGFFLFISCLTAAQSENLISETPRYLRESSSNNKNSILKYMDLARPWKGHMVLLRWEPDGTLNNKLMKKTMANADFRDWFPGKYNVNHTNPTPHGKVALLHNTDCIAVLDWTVKPPVPIVTWSLPNDAQKQEGKDFFLLPTPYDQGGFNRWCVHMAEEGTKKPFHDRFNKVMWRGAIHGNGDNEGSRKAIARMGADPKNASWLNATTTDVSQIEIGDMAHYKYQVDIGGVSGTSWGGLRWKMCVGEMLVFKVESWAKDWWHDLLQPWKHYIPVKEDMSDLRQQYEWAESHPEEAYKIAKEGAELCEENGSHESIEAYTQETIDSLPPASELIAKEAVQILSGSIGPNLLINH